MAAAKPISLQNIGACLIRIGKVDVPPDGLIEVTEAQLNSQGVKYLFNREELGFEDDPKRTREFLAKIREKAKPAQKEKTLAEREDGGTV
jgi:hypothetical protein